MRFSARHQDPLNRELILDDAPKPTRIGYIKSILAKRLLPNQFGSDITLSKILLPAEIHEEFNSIIRDENEIWDYDEHDAWAGLQNHLKSCSWLEFFDFIEMFGNILLGLERESPFIHLDAYENYKRDVNNLFEEDLIGWRLSNNAKLEKDIPEFTRKK